MKRQITVDNAIIKLQLILANLFITMSVIMGIALYSLQFQQYQPELFLPLFFSSFVISPLLTAFLMNKWKYWAFENVRNVHELKQRAILTKLVSENDSFFKKIDECNETDKEHWKIKEKFSKEDIFIEDASIPSETLVYHSRNLIYFYLFITVLTTTSLTFALTKNLIISCSISILSIIIFLFFNLQKIKRKLPVIIINSKGIEISTSGFIPWEKISKEDIISNRIGAYTKYYLVFKSPKGFEKVCISGLNIGRIKIGKLILFYKNRWQNKNK